MMLLEIEETLGIQVALLVSSLVESFNVLGNVMLDNLPRLLLLSLNSAVLLGPRVISDCRGW